MTQPANASKGSGSFGGRSYMWPPPGTPGEGEEFQVASVTTILGKGLPKPALTYWAARVVAEKATENPQFIVDMVKAQGRDETVNWLKRAPQNYTAKKAGMGTVAHAAIEAYVDGTKITDAYIRALLVDEFEDKPNLAADPAVFKQTKGYIRGALEFFDAVEPEILKQEVTVYSREHGYAGTTDIIARLHFGGPNGERLPCIVDFKTGKGVYPESGLQLCAYARADFIGASDGTETPLSEFGDIRHGVIVRLKPGGGFEAKSFNLSDDLFEVFLAVKGVALGEGTMKQAMRPGL